MEVLGLSSHQASSIDEIKKAYHKALLRAHPDKCGQGEFTIDQVKAAYQSLLSSRATGYAVVDLDDFHFDEVKMTYAYACRCGQSYNVTDAELERGLDLVGCDGCSLIIRVSYETAE